MGPGSRENLLQGMQPVERYPLGVLFPIVRGEAGIDPAFDEPDACEDAEHEDEAEPVQQKRRYIPPSSVGFSFFVQGDRIELQVQASAVFYTRTGARGADGRFLRREWRRQAAVLPEGEAVNLRAPGVHRIHSERVTVFDGRAEVYCLWRPFATGWIATISLCNALEAPGDSAISWISDRNEKSLFETELKCTVDRGEVGNYPRVDKALLTEEEQELELQYKDRHIYAVGHGAAADWTLDAAGRVVDIYSDFMPTVEVPQVTADVAGDDEAVLKIERLCQCRSDDEHIAGALDDFVTAYGNWVSGQKRMAADVSEGRGGAKCRETPRSANDLQCCAHETGRPDAADKSDGGPRLCHRQPRHAGANDAIRSHPWERQAPGTISLAPLSVGLSLDDH